MSYFNLTRVTDSVLCLKHSAKCQGGCRDQENQPALKGRKRLKKQQTTNCVIKSRINSVLQDNYGGEKSREKSMMTYGWEELDRTHDERVPDPLKQNAEIWTDIGRGWVRQEEVRTRKEIHSGDMRGGAWGVHTEVVKDDLQRTWWLRLGIKHCSPSPRCSLSDFGQVHSTPMCAYSGPGIVG